MNVEIARNISDLDMLHVSSDEEDVQDEFDIIFNSLEIETILCDIELSALDLSSDKPDSISDIAPRRLSKRCVCVYVCVCILPHLSQSWCSCSRLKCVVTHSVCHVSTVKSLCQLRVV